VHVASLLLDGIHHRTTRNLNKEKRGKALPFQQLSRRLKKKVNKNIKAAAAGLLGS
jgi:hypothetical protein